MLADGLSYFFAALLKKERQGEGEGSDTVAISMVCDKDLLQVESK